MAISNPCGGNVGRMDARRTVGSGPTDGGGIEESGNDDDYHEAHDHHGYNLSGLNLPLSTPPDNLATI